MYPKNASIKVKMLYSSLLITILPLLLLELFFFANTQKSMLRQLAASAGIRADQLQTGLENELGKVERMANMLADFTPLDTYLQTGFLDGGNGLNDYLKNIHPMLNGCNKTFDGVRVRIYHNRNIPNFSFELNNGLNAFLDSCRTASLTEETAGFWQHIDIRYNTYQPVYTYFYMVKEKSWPYAVSYLVTAHVDRSALLSQISFEPAKAGLIYVLDKNGNVLADNDSDNVLKAADNPAVSALSLLQSAQDGTHTNLNGKEFYTVCRQCDRFRIVYLLPWNDMYQEVFHSMLLLILAGILLLVLSGFLSLRTSGHILCGIETLMNKMQNMDRNRIQEIAGASVDSSSQDEIVRLDAVFTKMMMQIDHLVTMVQEKEQHLKDEIIARQQAEICVLQHQINPHYLFNTLEAIRMNLILRDDRENAEIVRLFADSFRRYIDMRDEDTTLLEEIDFIRKYIRIQNYRLDKRIVFTCEMDDTLQGLRIMKLLLQPLVENAVCHGVEEKPGTGHICLSVIRTGNLLQMTVSDDGIGMNEAHLKELKQKVFDREPTTAVGLQNVWQRLCLTYGSRAEMSIVSAYAKGTTVTLRIPFPE